MKKKLLLAAILACVSMTACGNTLSPSEAAARGVAPAGQEKAAVEAENTAETEGDAEVATTDEAGEETAEVILNADPSQTGNQVGLSLDDLAVTAGDVVIKIDADFAPDIDKVGTATIEEGQACLEGGYDTNYYYGGEALVVYTLAKAGQQLVYDIYVSDAQYTTVKGATVGTSTKDDVKAMYGTPSEIVGNSFIYSLDGGVVTAQFEFDNSDLLKTIDILKK